MARKEKPRFATPEVVRVFPTFVWKTRLQRAQRESINSIVLDQLGEMRRGLPELGPGESWQSNHGLHKLGELRELVSAIGAAVEAVLGFLKVGYNAFEITGCWATVSARGAPHRMHSHPNNFLSGVYYVQVQDGANTINFHDPRPQSGIIRPPVTELTAYNTDQVVVGVEEGVLLIFPSWLPHSVDPHGSDSLRISVSFNAMFSGYAENMSKPLWGDE